MTYGTGATLTGPPVFDDGPFTRVLAGLTRTGMSEKDVVQRAAIIALLAWMPLVAMAFVHDGLRFGPALRTLLGDVGVYARYLIAVPILVAADYYAGTRLNAIAQHFVDGGLIAPEARERYDALLRGARRWCRSWWAAVVIVVGIAACQSTMLEYLPVSEVPLWHRRGDSDAFSIAGWWHFVVSGPLLIALLLGWLWRLAVWSGFLWRVAQVPLDLCAAHPDRAAGLKFVGFSVRAFASIGCAVGVVFAGRVANKVIHEGVPIGSFQNAAVVMVVVVLVLCGAPLLAFVNRLLHEWQEGVRTYGRLAQQLGTQFEDKWFRNGHKIDAGVLEVTDFSAAVDLSGYASNVYDLQLTPADLRSFLFLAGATFLPLVPVVILTTPIDRLVKLASGVFF